MYSYFSELVQSATQPNHSTFFDRIYKNISIKKLTKSYKDI